MIKNGFTWYLLLTKRLLKKPSFWAVLLLVPVMVFGLGLAAQEESHILRIAVYAEPSSDPLGSRIAEDLEDLDGVVEYTVCGTEEELRREVSLSQADAGYLLPAELTGMMEAYLAGRESELPYDGHLISVIANEDTIQLQLAREQFFSVLYPYLSELAAEQFTLEQKEFAGLSEDYVRERIRALYSEERVEDSIFRFAYGTDAPEVYLDQNSYVMTPVRGMLSVFVFFTGLTMGMYLMKDRKAGMFQWVRYGKKPLYYWLSILTGTVLGGIAAYLGLWISGTFTEWWRELPRMALLVLAAAGFSGVLCQLVRNMAVYGAMLPLLVLLSVVLCPVFVSFHGLEPLKSLLPPYFYLNGLYSGRITGYLAVYALAANAAALLLPRLEGVRNLSRKA